VEAADVEIDWITLVAQILNFGILVLLLRHFLYRRIVDAVDRRREEIESRLEEARRHEQEADARAEKLDSERHRLEQERQEILDAAREDAAERRVRMLQQAKEEVEGARTQWKRGLHRQQESFLRELRDRAASATWAAVERALRDLADAELDERVVAAFARRLDDAASDDELVVAVAEADELVVRSARALSDEQQEQLAALLSDRFGARVEPRFTTSPDLLVGVQLEAGDRFVGWSGREYLTALEEQVGQLLGPADAEAEAQAPVQGAAAEDRQAEAPPTWDERVQAAASAEEAGGGRGT
jgi:F-type H+-transporting ATPase subunit b